MIGKWNLKTKQTDDSGIRFDEKGKMIRGKPDPTLGENIMCSERCFFDTDSDSHWYKIPQSLRETWEKFTVNDIDPEDYDTQREFEEQFGVYRIDGHPNRYSFIGVEIWK